jgi:hypothetical protein
MVAAQVIAAPVASPPRRFYHCDDFGMVALFHSQARDVSSWHETDMPMQSPDVRC